MSGYFTELERELTRAAARVEPRPRRSRARRIVLIAAAGLVLAGVPAVAVTGVLEKKRDRVPHLGARAAIAEGQERHGRRWQLRAAQTSAGFCFGLFVYSGEPDELAPGGGLSCGELKPGRLSVGAGYGGRSPEYALVYGPAPDEAASVLVRAGGATIVARTIDDHAGLAGRFYVVDVPRRALPGRVTVTAHDRDGRTIGKSTVG